MIFIFSLSSVSFAQDDDDAGGKLRDKMIEYIQTKLGLSKTEAERFQPVLLALSDWLQRRLRVIGTELWS